MATQKRRILVSLSDEIEAYVEQKAKDAGVSRSAVISMAVSRMIEQEKALDFISKLSKQQIDKVLEDD